jgi:hypothetical protein
VSVPFCCGARSHATVGRLELSPDGHGVDASTFLGWISEQAKPAKEAM